MRKIKKTKFLLASLLVLFVLIISVSLFLYQKTRANSPKLYLLAQHVGRPAAAFVFNYSKDFDKQIYLISKNLGLENKPHTQQKSPPMSGEIDAKGFLVMNLKPEHSSQIFSLLDSVLDSFLSLVEEESYTPEVPLDGTSLTAFLEEIWNGQTLLLGGATQMQFSIKDSTLLSFAPYFKKIFNLDIDFSKEIFEKNFPVSVQNFLNIHALDVSVTTISTDLDTKINHSQINVAITDPDEFLDAICSVKINPLDFCGRFDFSRKRFRENIKNIFSLFKTDFKLKFDVYWAQKGNVFVYSNQKSFLKTIFAENSEGDSNNIITSVSASGADFLVPSYLSQKYSRISFLFDMVQLQNKMISFAERMRDKSIILSDYFSSPTGDMVFSNLENKIDLFTSYFEKCSVTLDADGDKFLLETRLYSPSGDLFISNGKKLNPEFLLSMRLFVTKLISFGSYLLPRELISLPEPTVQYNGKWAIIHTEIPVKSMGPYIENMIPVLDRDVNTSEL